MRSTQRTAVAAAVAVIMVVAAALSLAGTSTGASGDQSARQVSAASATPDDVPNAPTAAGPATTAVPGSDTPPSTTDLPTTASIRSWCETEGVDQVECTFKFFHDLTMNEGVPAAIETVEAMKVADRDFIPECHHAYHGVGQAGPELMSARDALLLSTPLCQAGYIHGVVQLWTTQVSAEELRVQSRDFCTVLRGAGRSMEAFCGHGIGHALSLQFPTDIFDVADMCADTNGIESACLEGAIMEFGGSDHVTSHIKDDLGVSPPDSLTQDQRERLCEVAQENMRDRCYQKIFMLWDDVWNDGPAFASRCERAEEQAHRDGCIRSYGEVSMYSSWPLDVTDPDDKLNAALAPCAELREDLRGTCWEGLIETLWRDQPLEGAPRETICDVFPAEVLQACRNGEEAALIARKAA